MESVQAVPSSLVRMKYQLFGPQQNNLSAKLIMTSTSIHEIDCAPFRKVKANVDTLPPTQDALSLHLMWAHYQTKVWKQSLVTHLQLPSPTSCCWYGGWNACSPAFNQRT